MCRRGVIFLSMLLVVCGSINPLLAKEYPTKPIYILCTFTPGGSMDLMARIVADIAKKYLGQPMIVINKPVASGAIAAHDIVTSDPDGYKLLTASSVFIPIVLQTQKISFDRRDLTPIANFMEYKYGLAVKSDSPWKTLGDLLNYGSKNPEKLRWCHPGHGSTLQINTLQLFKKAGVQTIEVSYKGSPEMISALLGGHVDASAIPYGAAKEHVKAGTLRYLIFFSGRRYSDPSGVPCAFELGFPEAAKIPTLVGLYAHKQTPEEIKKILFNAFKKTYEDPEFGKRFEKFGEEPRFEGPEFLNEIIKKTEEIGTPILKELGLYVGQ